MGKQYGERAACARCGQDIEWLGKRLGWRDRGGNRQCVPWIAPDTREIVKPRKSARHLEAR